MGFLPQGAEAPKETSNYLKLIEGTIRFRVVSDAIFGYEYWTEDKKPVRLRKMPEKKPADIRLEKDGSYNIKHFWAFKVLDREDGRVKIFEITQNGVKREIESLLQDADWGEPTEYDIKITGEGKGLDRRYTVNPVPHKPLTAEEKSLVARTEINLEALFKGENPFDSEAPKMLPDEEEGVKLSDVPF
jgi:hypothetical protein